MVLTDWINLWILGPAIGFGLFLVVTSGVVLLLTRFRNNPNVSFVIFALCLLSASLMLMFLIQNLVDAPSTEMTSRLFANFTISVLLSSISYFIFVKYEIDSYVNYWSLFAVTAGAGVLLTALSSLGLLNTFSFSHITTSPRILASAYLLAAGFYSASALIYYRRKYTRFPFFGIARC